MRRKRSAKKDKKGIMPIRWDRIDATSRSAILTRSRWSVALAIVNAVVAVPLLFLTLYRFGRSFDGLMRLLPISAIVTVLVLLLTYVLSQSSSLRRMPPTPSNVSRAARLASNELSIAAAICAATLALALSATNLMSVPALWLVEHITLLRQTGVWFIREILGYAVSTVIGFMLNRTFKERTKQCGKP
jgi:hypothetical protein